MKVIELLNKIANGEEVPDNIKYDGIDYYWCNSCKIYERIEDGRNDLYNDIDNLNDEIEIVEENDRIDSTNYQTSQIPPWFRNEELIRVINNNFELQTRAIKLLINEINKMKKD